MAIQAHIGSELFRAYGEEQGRACGYSFMLLDEGERDGYRTWLANQDYAQKIVAGRLPHRGRAVRQWF